MTLRCWFGHYWSTDPNRGALIGERERARVQEYRSKGYLP